MKRTVCKALCFAVFLFSVFYITIICLCIIDDISKFEHEKNGFTFISFLVLEESFFIHLSLALMSVLGLWLSHCKKQRLQFCLFAVLVLLGINMVHTLANRGANKQDPNVLFAQSDIVWKSGNISLKTFTDCDDSIISGEIDGIELSFFIDSKGAIQVFNSEADKDNITEKVNWRSDKENWRVIYFNSGLLIRRDSRFRLEALDQIFGDTDIIYFHRQD